MNDSKDNNDSNGSRHLDFNRLAWFVSGLIIGNTLHTLTTLVLVISWVIVTNEPLPTMLGGYYPQNILRSIFEYIDSKLKRKNKNNHKNNHKNTRTVDPKSDLSGVNEPQPKSQSMLQFQGSSIVAMPINTMPVMMNTPFILDDKSRVVEQ